MIHPTFLCATQDYTTLERHVSAPLLRRVFSLDTLPDAAKLTVACPALYGLFINGHEITKGALAPYISNPDDLIYTDTYNLLPYLREGKNALGLILGNGMLNNPGGAVWKFEQSPCRTSPCVAVELTLTNGEHTTVLSSDEGFRTHPSPITFDDFRLGEFYDARLELTGWSEPDFDDSDWQKAIATKSPRGELVPCSAQPIGVIEERKPVRITPHGDGFLYDFGINSAGVCRLSVKGEAGQIIELHHGEILKDGHFCNDNLRFYYDYSTYYDQYNQVARLTCSGGEDIFVPRFTYFGFRYVLVEGITKEQATDSLLTYLVMSSDLPTIGGFASSDERVNALFRATVNSDRSNFYYFPTDCPHREKNGWTGDASMSADHMTLLYEVDDSYEEWLRNIRKAQHDTGALPGIIPTFGWGFHWGNGPAWDSVLFSLPYELYRLRGNTRVIRDNAHAMLRYLSYIMTRRSENGTVAVGLGDWVPVGKKSSAYDVPLAFTDSVMVMDMARKAAEMFSAVDLSHEAAYAEGIFADMRQTVRRELVDTEAALVQGNCQSGQAIGLYYGVFEPEEETRAFAHLLSFLREKNNNFDCGFLGLHCLFHVLTRFGETELAYHLITKPDYPSYGHWIDLGFTSIPEQFMPDDCLKISFNHHFLGDVSRWFMEAVAGLRVVDHHTVEIAPHPVAALSYAEAWHDLPSGRVAVRWERLGDQIKLTYTCPADVTCRVQSERSFL